MSATLKYNTDPCRTCSSGRRIPAIPRSSESRSGTNFLTPSTSP